GPVENGPAGQPVAGAEGTGAETHGQIMLEETADGGDEGFENVHRRADNEQEQNQQYGQYHVDVGKPFDAVADPRQGRADEGDRDDGNNDDLQSGGAFHAPQIVETTVDLQCAQTQRCRGAEQRGKHG